MSLIVKNVLYYIALIVVGVLVGFLGRYFYVSFVPHTDGGEDVEIVYAKDGSQMRELPFRGSSPENVEAIAQYLEVNNIEFKLTGGRIMLAAKNAGYAGDLLVLAGMMPGARSYTYTDITAKKEIDPARYELQSLLATRNMLSNMLRTMLPEIKEALVAIIIQDYRKNVRVKITLKENVQSLPEGSEDLIKHHIAATLPDINENDIAVEF